MVLVVAARAGHPSVHPMLAGSDALCVRVLLEVV
jgi:hypothetical protein